MDVNQFGKIKFIRRSNARGIRVTIYAERLTVVFPPICSQEEVLAFLSKNADKILAKQDLLNRKMSDSRLALLITSENPLQTLTFRVEVECADVAKVHAHMQGDVLTIRYPNVLSVTDAQPYFWNAITYFLRKEAKRVLPSRTEQLAAQYGFKYADVKVKAVKSRWGSCSSAGNINLSVYLMLAPQHLVDYVILHELCHTVEMNHSERFWALMDQVTDCKAKKLRMLIKSIKIPQF